MFDPGGGPPLGRDSLLSNPPAAASARAAPGRPETPTAPLRLRPCFVHDQMAVAEEAPVQHLDRLHGFFPRGHIHEPEPTRPSRELIGDDAHRPHGSGVLEELVSSVILSSFVRSLW